ncbi:MAG: T9SS type A sorting domain-containing protein [Saprospiraceae bacterium]|nr:T9SS type A sorting domain-containing protein [Saprospiraceae bacterium]
MERRCNNCRFGKNAKKVLLIEQFNNPFQYLAADVNYDGKVSTSDMIEVRRLILGIKDTFSNVHNWRFVPTYFFDPTVCDFTSFNTNPLKAKCYFNIGGDSLSYFPNSQSKTFMDEFTVPLVNTYLRKQNTWNWKAAKSGDVDCDANDTKLIEDTEEKLFLKNLHRCYYTDEYVNFTVKARTDQEVTAWEMGVRLNPDVLEFNALENTNSGTPLDVENFGLTKWNQGQFRALWIDTLLTKINMQNYTELYKLRLKVKQSTCNFDSLFLLSGKVLPTKFYNDTAEIKNVSILLNIEDVNNGNHSQLVKNVYPNPFDKKISIEVELEKEGFAEISLYDNSGRLINNKKEFCNKGINILTFEDNKGYQQGIIHYVITTKEATQRGTILNTKY